MRLLRRCGAAAGDVVMAMGKIRLEVGISPGHVVLGSVILAVRRATRVRAARPAAAWRLLHLRSNRVRHERKRSNGVIDLVVWREEKVFF